MKEIGSDKMDTLIMGIVNVTPDSFYDGGQYFQSDCAIHRMRELVEQGADIIDLGAESSRPGALPISVQEELNRLSKPLEAASALDVPISVDTYKSEVARYALQRGASMINDISALRNDPTLAKVIAENDCYCVLMHMQGTPLTMQHAPHYENVTQEVYDFLAQRVEYAINQGIMESRIWIDPGFGFGKTVSQNLELLRHLDKFLSLGLPILIGTSNKSMIGAVLGVPVEARMEGTAATIAIGILKGVRCVRVHDVKAMKRVARMCDAVLGRIAI